MLLTRGSELAAQVKAAEAAQHEADAALERAQRAIANVVQDGAPAGGEDDWTLLETHGEPTQLDFVPRDHLELGEALGIIDTERGAKVSGGAILFSDRLRCVAAAGVVTARGAEGRCERVHHDDSAGAGAPGDYGGHRLPGRARAEVYHLADDDLYLVGTSEVPMARSYHSGEILDLSGGPKTLCGLVIMLSP